MWFQEPKGEFDYQLESSKEEVQYNTYGSHGDHNIVEGYAEQIFAENLEGYKSTFEEQKYIDHTTIPWGMELDEIGTLPISWLTPDARGEGPPSAGPEDISVIAVTTEDAVTTLTGGAEDATQTVGIDWTDVTDVTCIQGMEVEANWVDMHDPEVGTVVRDHTELWCRDLEPSMLAIAR